jgi:hypothetical protein
MLKDSLTNLLDSQSESKECKFGKLLKSLDEDTIKILISAMAGEVSTINLVRTLRSEGHSFSREFLGTKRNCFKDIDSAKSCCVLKLMKKTNLYPQGEKNE